MYEIYETFNSNGKYLSYYTIRKLYNGSSDKRKNLQFRIYDNLRHSHFDKVVSGNKSIIYDHVNIVLEEFQLQDISDEQLWPIMIITSEVLKKKCNCFTSIVLDETFVKIEKYLKEEKIRYGRLRKYGGSSNNKPEVTNPYFNQYANPK